MKREQGRKVPAKADRGHAWTGKGNTPPVTQHRGGEGGRACAGSAARSRTNIAEKRSRKISELIPTPYPGQNLSRAWPS